MRQYLALLYKLHTHIIILLPFLYPYKSRFVNFFPCGLCKMSQWARNYDWVNYVPFKLGGYDCFPSRFIADDHPW